MSINWSNVVDSFANAKYSLEDIWARIKAVYTALVEEGDVAALLDVIKESLASVLTYLPIALIVLCAIVTLFGKKLFGLEKFLLIFALGFAGGVLFVAPLAEKLITIPSYITGAVVGLICAILCKFIYWLLYVAAFGYATYYVFYAGAYVEAVTSYTKGNLLYSLIAVAVVVIIALLLRKYIEMLATSALGAFGIVSIVDNNFFDFANIGFATEEIVKLVAIGVITLIGFIVQVKTRKRY